MKSFDTYTHINKLRKAGFNEEQAAAIIKLFMDNKETDTSYLATQKQLESLKHEIIMMILNKYIISLKWISIAVMLALAAIILIFIKPT